jgi:hypothetical protein
MDVMSCWGMMMKRSVFWRMVPRMSAAAAPTPIFLEGVLFWKLTTPTLSLGPVYSPVGSSSSEMPVREESSFTCPDVLGAHPLKMKIAAASIRRTAENDLVNVFIVLLLD